MKSILTKSLMIIFLMMFSAASFGSKSAIVVRKLPVTPSLKRLIKPNPTPKAIKCKLYYGETIMIVWLDLNGDNECDGAILYEKSDGSYIKEVLTCQQADEADMQLEPRI